MNKLIINCWDKLKEFLYKFIGILLLSNLFLSGNVLAGTPQYTTDESGTIIPYGSKSITGQGGSSTSLIRGGTKTYEMPPSKLSERIERVRPLTIKSDKNRRLIISRALTSDDSNPETNESPNFNQLNQIEKAVLREEFEAAKIREETLQDALESKERITLFIDNYKKSVVEYLKASKFDYKDNLGFFQWSFPDSLKFSILEIEIKNSDQQWAIYCDKITEFLKPLNAEDLDLYNDTRLIEPESSQAFMNLLKLSNQFKNASEKNEFSKIRSEMLSITYDLVNYYALGLPVGIDDNESTTAESIDLSKLFMSADSKLRSSSMITSMERATRRELIYNKALIDNFDSFASPFLDDLKQALPKKGFKTVVLLSRYQYSRRLLPLWKEFIAENPKANNRFSGQITTTWELLNNREALLALSNYLTTIKLELQNKKQFLLFCEGEIKKVKRTSAIFSAMAINKFQEYDVLKIPEGGISREKRRLLSLLIHLFNPGVPLSVNAEVSRLFPTGVFNLFLEADLTSRLNYALSLKMYTHCKGLIPGLD